MYPGILFAASYVLFLQQGHVDELRNQFIIHLHEIDGHMLLIYMFVRHLNYLDI